MDGYVAFLYFVRKYSRFKIISLTYLYKILNNGLVTFYL